ncbi:exodeoxyribonuclease VII large subunit [Marinicrinis sediminis]|uniref:Exodeoxyribonuclease 7 large subunit n=1 Tax=Marinicrinis sediminis TaxID=1652465 RepID=A0ABW5RCM7_9BACL
MTPATPQQVLSVRELTRTIKQRLETDPAFSDIWVQGEISNFIHHRSGHMYFTLKDKDSRIKSVMFASHNRTLPFLLKEGAKVLARGSVSVYERDGQYQLYVTQMQPDGIGSLFLAFEQLKEKLKQEGLFDPNVKKPIPSYPRAIGLVTSPTGAAVRDMMITLERRFPSIPVLLYPAHVQGVKAAPSIVRGIQIMNELDEVDVLIVGRGGGSLEELWAFNEEQVARAIFQSRIPVISAVGHETDTTIADYVADLRAATPTAAAELAVPDQRELKQRLKQLQERLGQSLTVKSADSRKRLERLQASPYLTHPKRYLLQEPSQYVDRLKEQLTYALDKAAAAKRQKLQQFAHQLNALHPRQRLQGLRKDTTLLRQQLTQSLQMVMKDKHHQLRSEMRQLDALSPLKIMQRGYSLVYDETGTQVRKSAAELKQGEQLRVRMQDGQVHCEVLSVEGEGNNGK